MRSSPSFSAIRLHSLRHMFFVLALACGCSQNTSTPADTNTSDGPKDAAVDKVGDTATEATSPDQRPDANDSSSKPIWLVHLSDQHFGDSDTVDALTKMIVAEVLPVISPTVTVNSGDMVDDGGDAASWSAYVAASAGLAPYPSTIEVVGNHDAKHDGKPAFLSHTITGKATGKLHGLSFVDVPSGKLRIVRTNTADSTSNLINLAGLLGEEQHAELMAVDRGEAVGTVVVGHHPMTGLVKLQLASATRMQSVIDRFDAKLYLCGHVHASSLSWLEGKTLVVQAASLGRSSSPSMMLVALDEQAGPSARQVDLAPGSPISWPLAMITRPANATLATQNPHATSHAAGATIEVGALAFAPSPIKAAQARLGNGEWTAMSSDDGTYWTASLDSGQTAGQIDLAVRVTSSEGEASDQISIQVGSQ